MINKILTPQNCLFVVLFSYVLTGNAQHQVDNFSLADTTTSWFDDKIKMRNNQIATGYFREISPPTKGNNPYFGDVPWDLSSLYYRQQQFDNIPLLYDIEQQEVFIRDTSNFDKSFLPICLYTQNLDWFTINDRYFVHYKSEIPGRPAGIYEQVYAGSHLTFLIAHLKIPNINNGKIFYTTNNHFLLCHQGNCERIVNRSGIKRRFKKSKKAIKEISLRYRIGKLVEARPEALRALGELCDQQISQQ